MGRKRRKFTTEFKADLVRLVLDAGRSITSVAKEYDVPASSLSSWVKQARVDRGEGAAGALTTAEKEELTRLRRENRQLQMERDILKKATAFFAKESK